MSRPYKRRHYFGRQYDSKSIEQSLRAKARQFLLWLYPNIVIERKHAFIGDVAGNEGQSLRIDHTGSRVGMWCDFATDDTGGTFISLYMAARQYKKERFVQALSELSSWAGVCNVPAEFNMHKRRLSKASVRKRIDIGPAVDTWTYINAAGVAVLRMSRHEYINHKGIKKKEFRPFNLITQTYGMPTPRPLYNEYLLHPNKVIIFCEGEKAADAITAAGFVGTTIMGGARAIKQASFDALVGCRVILWPDNDAAGELWQADLLQTLPRAGVTIKGVIEPPPDAPAKWDAADTTISTIKKMIGKYND